MRLKLSNTSRKYCLGISIALVAAVSVAWVLAIHPYGYRDFGMRSEIAPALRVFYYNESIHPDTVPGCWYDSGDYIVFAQRNAQTLYYLSLAYTVAQQQATKSDLSTTIRSQLGCLDEMLTGGWKQFRDQGSHGMRLPPLLARLIHASPAYGFKPGEGRDVLLLRALIARNLGDTDATQWFDRAEKARGITVSERCCEEGPVRISDHDYEALKVLGGLDSHPLNGIWGISLPTIASLERGEYAQVGGMLRSVVQKWTKRAEQFDYIGGNYDIAGTIAAERLYYRATGDTSLYPLSVSLYSYLHGDNAYAVDFTSGNGMYHPCGWWGDCRLQETLMNGIDERQSWDTSREDIWRLTEVQLVGQAKYVLALVLYKGL